ncbi:MAG: DUF2023 family protein [Marinifilaceae bacterium]|jgi:hypothetical protein|nr:DUF2023 family protein [Marinifilaceae bacterium]
MNKFEYKTTDIQVLTHHIYEYHKGLRDLVLHTMHSNGAGMAETILKNKGIPYRIEYVSNKKVNIFFGKPECIKIVESFGEKPLNQFSDEEDFILGIMLGYDRSKQCDRYLKRKKNWNVA